FVSRSAVATYASCARLEQALGEPDDARYPDDYGLARRLRLIARLIRSGLTTPIYYTQLGGFDTHAEQVYRHSSLLRQLGRSRLPRALARAPRAFLAARARSGEGGRVAALVFSDSGRRLHENASAGTDHGTAAPVFVPGRPVQGDLHGPYPDLARLEDGDPRH